jgi:hypothetical protein
MLTPPAVKNPSAYPQFDVLTFVHPPAESFVSEYGDPIPPLVPVVRKTTKLPANPPVAVSTSAYLVPITSAAVPANPVQVLVPVAATETLPVALFVTGVPLGAPVLVCDVHRNFTVSGGVVLEAWNTNASLSAAPLNVNVESDPSVDATTDMPGKNGIYGTGALRAAAVIRSP